MPYINVTLLRTTSFVQRRSKSIYRIILAFALCYLHAQRTAFWLNKEWNMVLFAFFLHLKNNNKKNHIGFLL